MQDGLHDVHTAVSIQFLTGPVSPLWRLHCSLRPLNGKALHFQARLAAGNDLVPEVRFSCPFPISRGLSFLSTSVYTLYFDVYSRKVLRTSESCMAPLQFSLCSGPALSGESERFRSLRGVALSVGEPPHPCEVATKVLRLFGSLLRQNVHGGSPCKERNCDIQGPCKLRLGLQEYSNLA